VLLSACQAQGKALLGSILAKTLGMNFTDNDIVIDENTEGYCRI
jgi:shikimate kinase